MSELLDRAGLKRTPQRMAIMDYLEGNMTHPSAEEIFAAVSVKFPAMSMATVYNTLNTLCERRGLTELTIDRDRKRFDPNTSPHHHMICTGCGRIEDIYESFPLSLPHDKMGGYRIVGSRVDFFGVCHDCDINNISGDKGDRLCALTTG